MDLGTLNYFSYSDTSHYSAKRLAAIRTILKEKPGEEGDHSSLRRTQGLSGNIHHESDDCGLISFATRVLLSQSHFHYSELNTGSSGILNQKKVTQSVFFGLQTPAGVSLNIFFPSGRRVEGWSLAHVGGVSRSIIQPELLRCRDSSPGVQPWPAEECETRSAFHTPLKPQPRRGNICPHG